MRVRWMLVQILEEDGLRQSEESALNWGGEITKRMF